MLHPDCDPALDAVNVPRGLRIHGVLRSLPIHHKQRPGLLSILCRGQANPSIDCVAASRRCEQRNPILPCVQSNPLTGDRVALSPQWALRRGIFERAAIRWAVFRSVRISRSRSRYVVHGRSVDAFAWSRTENGVRTSPAVVFVVNGATSKVPETSLNTTRQKDM